LYFVHINTLPTKKKSKNKIKATIQNNLRCMNLVIHKEGPSAYNVCDRNEIITHYLSTNDGNGRYRE
jgi:hypothetical protein